MESFLLHLECLNIRRSRDKIYMNDYFLNKFEPPIKKYSINLFKNEKINKTKMRKFCDEKESSNADSFNNNSQIIKELYQYAELESPIHNLKDVPCICFILNTEDILTFKILYRELIKTSSDFKFDENNYHVYDINTKTIIQNTINTIKTPYNPLNKTSATNSTNYLYSNSSIFNDFFNEKDLTRQYHSILLSEKVRRGFYREFGFIHQYRKIFIHQRDTRNLINLLFSTSNTKEEIKIFLDYSSEIIRILEFYALSI